MQRVVILGPPGSGKSTLAWALGERHGLSVFHLDQAYWRPRWVAAEPEAFLAEVERLARLPAWIIEGNYTGTIAPRLRAADTVIYLDVPSWLCTLRVLKRMLGSYGRVRSDAAPGCPERLSFDFLSFVWTWNRRSRAKGLAIVAEFPGRRIIADGRDAERLIAAG